MFWVGSIFSSCEYPTLSMDQFILVEWDNFFAIGSFYRYILRGIRTGGWVAVALWEVVGCVNKDLSHEKKVHGRLIDNCILWCCGSMTGGRRRRYCVHDSGGWRYGQYVWRMIRVYVSLVVHDFYFSGRARMVPSPPLMPSIGIDNLRNALYFGIICYLLKLCIDFWHWLG